MNDLDMMVFNTTHRADAQFEFCTDNPPDGRVLKTFCCLPRSFFFYRSIVPLLNANNQELLRNIT
jgi:hypothetical protein